MNDISDKNDAIQRDMQSRFPVRHRSAWRRALWIVPVLLVIGAVAWVVFRPQPAQQGRQGRPPGGITAPVGTAKAEKGDIPIVLNALGSVTPLATVTVRTQISGYLTQVAFEEGQMVHAGDFLAQVDPRPYQISLAQFQGQLQRDQALLREAELNLNRYRTLVAQDSIAKQQLDTQQSLVEQYKGTIEMDQAQINTAKLNLAYCHITAPLTGRLGLRQVDQGNYVTPGDTNGLVVITQLQPISVVFTLPEDSLPAVMERVRGGATLPVTVFDRSQTTRLATGTLTTVDNQIDASTGTVKLRAKFDNQDSLLFPNQFVTTQLLVNTLAGATVIPNAAVQRGVPGTFVYVVKPDETVSIRPIKPGPSWGDKTAVASGLEVGETVVTEGADKLRDGAKVVLPGATPAAAPPPQGEARRKKNGGG